MRVGFYECDITPPLGGNMPGYYRVNPAQNVFERLYAKACVIEEDGKYAAIVALDTCEYVDEMTKIVHDRVFEYTGIPAESICIHVVHTHKGAPVEECPWVGQRPDFEYRKVYYRLAADAIILAYLRMTPAVAKFGQSKLEGVAFNRNYVQKDGKIVSFSPRGELDHMLAGTDTDFPVLVFESEGKPLGALVSFACHQDCTGREVNGYSSDYSGVMGKELKRIYGEDFVSVFMIGTAGDINHLPIDPEERSKMPPFYYREIGKRAAHAAMEAIANAIPVGGGVAVCREEISIPRRQAEPMETQRQLDEWLKEGNLMRVRNLLYYSKVNRESHSVLPLQVIRIGDVGIYVMPGEIYVNFGLAIKKRSKFAHHFVIENSNAFGGYIPTPEAFAPESDLYEKSLCFGSRHVPEAGDMMVEKLLEMAERV